MNTTTPTTEPRLDPELGKRLAALALADLEARRALIVRRARRVLLALLLAGETAVGMDRVRQYIGPLPAGVNPVCLGAVPRPLAGLGIIVRAGYRPTLLASGHGRPTALWSLADRTGARAWIDQHGGGTPGEILHAALVVASIEEARQTKHHPPQEEPHA